MAWRGWSPEVLRTMSYRVCACDLGVDRGQVWPTGPCLSRGSQYHCSASPLWCSMARWGEAGKLCPLRTVC